MAIYDYRIAAGYNNAVGLVNLEAIKPTGDRYFFPPKARGQYTAGMRKTRADGTPYLSGYASLEWVFDAMTYAQFKYLRDTYCAGGYGGKVTVRTRMANATYYNANAILNLPFESSLEDRYTGYQNVRITLTRVITL